MQDCRPRGEEEEEKEDAGSTGSGTHLTSAAVRPAVPRAEDKELPEKKSEGQEELLHVLRYVQQRV